MKYDMTVSLYDLTPQQVAEIRDAIENKVPATVDVTYMFGQQTETEISEEDLNVKAVEALRDEGLTVEAANAAILRFRHAGLTFKERR